MREAATAPKTERRFERSLTASEERRIEVAVNAVIAADLPVTEAFMPLDAARASYATSHLPEGFDGPVRIVVIGNYDRCPCLGPHVASTGVIGALRITSSGQQDGGLRIRFKPQR